MQISKLPSCWALPEQHRYSSSACEVHLEIRQYVCSFETFQDRIGGIFLTGTTAPSSDEPGTVTLLETRPGRSFRPLQRDIIGPCVDRVHPTLDCDWTIFLDSQSSGKPAISLSSFHSTPKKVPQRKQSATIVLEYTSTDWLTRDSFLSQDS